MCVETNNMQVWKKTTCVNNYSKKKAYNSVVHKKK